MIKGQKKIEKQIGSEGLTKTTLAIELTGYFGREPERHIREFHTLSLNEIAKAAPPKFREYGKIDKPRGAMTFTIQKEVEGSHARVSYDAVFMKDN
jgi:hypothetical protein